MTVSGLDGVATAIRELKMFSASPKAGDSYTVVVGRWSRLIVLRPVPSAFSRGRLTVPRLDLLDGALSIERNLCAGSPVASRFKWRMGHRLVTSEGVAHAAAKNLVVDYFDMIFLSFLSVQTCRCECASRLWDAV